MTLIEQRVAREAKAMTRMEVIQKAMEGRITWIQAAEICRMTARNMRRLLRTVYEYYTDENKRWVAGSKVEIMALGK